MKLRRVAAASLGVVLISAGVLVLRQGPPASERVARPTGDPEECPEGIEGRGLGAVESYGPKPYFEEFNLWRTGIPNTRRGCLRIAAGQQATHMSDGEDDPTTYEPSGALFIFGDYRRDPDGITGTLVPLPRPVRIIGFSGSGFRAVLRLQSLEDCSTIAYDVRSITFVADPFDAPPPCPVDPER